MSPYISPGAAESHGAAGRLSKADSLRFGFKCARRRCAMFSYPPHLSVIDRHTGALVHISCARKGGCVQVCVARAAKFAIGKAQRAFGHPAQDTVLGNVRDAALFQIMNGPQ
jgi:hypothetical protein